MKNLKMSQTYNLYLTRHPPVVLVKSNPILEHTIKSPRYLNSNSSNHSSRLSTVLALLKVKVVLLAKVKDMVRIMVWAARGMIG